MSYSTAVITRDVIKHILTPSAIGLPDGLFTSTVYNLIHLTRNTLDGFLQTDTDNIVIEKEGLIVLGLSSKVIETVLASRQTSNSKGLLFQLLLV